MVGARGPVKVAGEGSAPVSGDTPAITACQSYLAKRATLATSAHQALNEQLVAGFQTTLGSVRRWQDDHYRQSYEAATGQTVAPGSPLTASTPEAQAERQSTLPVSMCWVDNQGYVVPQPPGSTAVFDRAAVFIRGDGTAEVVLIGDAGKLAVERPNV
jgi:hypothetical protein